MIRVPGASAGTSYLAPGGVHSGAMRLPGADSDSASRLDPDDHLVEAGTRQEMFRGQLVEVMPARPGHGDLHTRLDKVVDHHVIDGYVSSTDLLTRRSEDSDFATDTSVRRAGADPVTGKRYREELSFEIFFRESLDYARERARDVLGSGGRRMFGIFVKERWPGSDDAGVVDCAVAEWSIEHDAWEPLGLEQVIADPCLYPPIPVKALVDAVAASDAAARALIARHNHVIEEHLARASLEARREERRHSIFRILDRRGIALDDSQRARILACDDLDTLERWLLLAIDVQSGAALLD
jgi:hypothetical protein